MSGMWWESGMAELKLQAQQLFDQMLESQPGEAQWAQLRRYLSMLSDLRDYGLMQCRREPASETAPAPQPEVENAAEVPEAPRTVENSPVAPPSPEKAGPDRPYTGTFYQGLRGGVLVTEDGLEIPVGERIVAAARFGHGDLVKAVPQGKFPDGRMKYFFVKLREGSGHNPDRQEALGIVEAGQDGQGVVRAGAIQVLVPAFELRQLGAGEGDVVTVAYMHSELQDGRVEGTVLRLHESDLPPAEPGQPQRRRVDNPVQPDPEQEPSVRFIGRPRVVVVGGRNWPYYRDGITALGGEPSYADGFAVERNMEEMVAGADIVIVVTSYCSHGHHAKAKAAAKQNGRLFYSTTRENWSGLRSLLVQEIIPAWNAQVNEAAD